MYWLTGGPLTGVGVELGFAPLSVAVYDDCDESGFFFLVIFFCAESDSLEGGTAMVL